jgi:hypothetical protein
VVVEAPLDSVLLALDPDNTLDEAPQPDLQQEAAADQQATQGEGIPRNLQGAVEALAKFTSETVAGERLEARISAHSEAA